MGRTGPGRSAGCGRSMGARLSWAVGNLPRLLGDPEPEAPEQGDRWAAGAGGLHMLPTQGPGQTSMGTCCWTLGSPQPCSGSKGAAGKVLRRGLGGRPGWGTWRMGMGRKDPGTEGPAGLCPGLEIQEGCPEPAGPPADRGGGRGWSGSGQGARAWEMRGRADRMGLWRKTIPVLIWKISQNLVQVQRPRQALRLAGRASLPSLPAVPAAPASRCPSLPHHPVPCAVRVMSTLQTLDRGLPYLRVSACVSSTTTFQPPGCP